MLKVVGSNPWMDIFSHIFVVKIVMFEKTKINLNKKQPAWTILYIEPKCG